MAPTRALKADFDIPQNVFQRSTVEIRLIDALTRNSGHISVHRIGRASLFCRPELGSLFDWSDWFAFGDRAVRDLLNRVQVLYGWRPNRGS